MDSLFKRQNVTQDEKAVLYGQILKRYLNYYDKRMTQLESVLYPVNRPQQDRSTGRAHGFA